MDYLGDLLGAPVTDPEEEAFVVFSQAIPSQSLGFVDPQASEITVTVADRDLTIHQSRGLLTSDRKEGSTGAVVWKVTPLLAEWIASPNFLFRANYLTPDSVAIELGCGVSGVVALTLSPKIKKYIATDQDYVLRLLRQNIAENLPTSSPATSKKQRSKKKPPHATAEPIQSNIDTLALDWELDSISSLPSLLGQGSVESRGHHEGVDLIIACDCIYNDALIEPLNSTCAQICRIRSSSDSRRPTLCLVAQQLRSPEIFEAWLKSFNQLFHVWKVQDDLLTESLRENSGFIVHIGVTR